MMRKSSRWPALAPFLAILFGPPACDRAEPAAESAAEPAAEPATEPDRSASGADTNPLTTVTPAEDPVFVGVVLQRIRAGGYAYLEVHTGDRTRWVATMGEGRKSGSRVQIQAFGTQRDFHSRRLDRDFDELVFGMVADATEIKDDV